MRKMESCGGASPVDEAIALCYTGPFTVPGLVSGSVDEAFYLHRLLEPHSLVLPLAHSTTRC
jgi:hypothetical protein